MNDSNLHTHTIYSDGKNTIEETVQAAIDRNMISIGISDHSYTGFDLSYCMTEEEAYLVEMQRIKGKYENQIEVYTGLECDGYSQMDHREAFDYIIGSCHYVKSGNQFLAIDKSEKMQRDDVQRYFNNDFVVYTRAYFDSYVESTRYHQPDILGHFNLPVKFGCVDEDNPEYRKQSTEALLGAMEVTNLIELNTGAIAKRCREVPYPSMHLLREAYLHGGRIVLSSDAHCSSNLLFWFEEGKTMLRNIGFRSIWMLVHHQFTEFPL